MKCLVLMKKNNKDFYNSSKAYALLGCRCDNCKSWKSQDNKKWRKPENKYTKKYYIQNKEEILAKHKERYKSNKNKIREYQDAYFKTEDGKEANRRGARKRRALKHGSGSVKYTESQVLELYGTSCHICGNDIDTKLPRKVGKPGWEQGLHIEHVFDIALGGPDTIENVRPSHAMCNLTKKPRKNDIIDSTLTVL